ncbi:M16 family metallopeptidase [Tuberibacillus sp. Marseille-P3662]|uniref:M16 family metallopeptidase n=1 Tax=Tuberibacillus sp. Marseille-P3662 TaxID=1965358 RepID=UPI000A1CBDBE|nr:pitrilysin family protein [Tuberibacillus sp. Marseille-P3662]
MVIKHTCKNGVRIVLEEVPSVRSATIGIWIGAGSRYEDDSNNGISHFIEHMLFKGTGTRRPRDIAEAFDRIGGQVNAFTSKEYTCLYAKVLDEHTHYAVNILTDMLFHSIFDETEMQKEKQVVLEEIKMYEDTPDDRVHDLLSEASFGHHPLGMPILGREATLQAFDRSRLKTYMNRYYKPENIVVSIAGNVDETIIPAIEEAFSAFQAQNHHNYYEQPQFYPDQLAQKKDTEQAHICLGFDGFALGDERIYPLIILNNVLGGSMSSRLFQEVREERGLAYSVFSYHMAFKDSGLLTVYGGTGADQIEDLYETIFSTIDDIKQHGITETELQNSREQLKGNLMLSLESTSSRMSRNAKNELLLERHQSLDEIVNRIESVSHQDVKGVAHDLFNHDFSSSLINPSGEWPSRFQ